MRKILLSLFLIFSFSIVSHAQGFPYHDIALSSSALYIANATITVCNYPSAGIPCNNPGPVSLSQNQALTIPLSNPFLADNFGNYTFWIGAGTYDITVTAPGFAGKKFSVSFGTTASLLASNNAWTGNETHVGSETFSGGVFINTQPLSISSVLNASGGGAFSGTFSGNPSFTGNPGFSGSVSFLGTPLFLGPGNTGVLTAGTGLLGGSNAWIGNESHSGIESFAGSLNASGPFNASGGGSFVGSFSGSPTVTGLWTFSSVPLFPSQTANFFYASPSGSTGVPLFRGIVNLDLAGTTAILNPMNTLGDVIYGAASGIPTRLAGSTSASVQCLQQTGNGTISAAPVWGNCTTGSGGGTVTTFSSGNFNPLFTTSVATAGSTPALSFIAVSQSQNLFYGSPSGSPGNPIFRAIVGADLPNPSASTLGGVQSYVAVAHQWINAVSTSGVHSSTQPAFADLSDTIAGCVTALNSVSGVLACNAQVPLLNTVNTWTSLQTFNGGISGSGNTGNLLAGTGILGTANVWTVSQTFNAGITGVGSTGNLTPGSGILGTANIWTALQTFNGSISGSGNTGGLAPGAGILGGTSTWTGRQTFNLNGGNCSANQFATGISTILAPVCAQPSASNLSNGTTGSGAAVLSNSPTITSPSLTTPSIGGSTITRVQVSSVAIPSTAGFTFGTVTITWPASFSDASYYPWCLASDQMALGAMTVNGIASKSASQMVVGYNNNTGGTQTGTMFCGALHP